MREMNYLAEHYLKEPINFYIVEKDNFEYPNILEDHHEIQKFPAILLIKGKRNKYILYETESFNDQYLTHFIDEVLGGGGTYNTM